MKLSKLKETKRANGRCRRYVAFIHGRYEHTVELESDEE